jgi:hypothetical protein
MTDTSPDMEARYRERILALSPADRFEMASRMFSTARTLAIAGIRLESGSSLSIQERLFRRLYAQDFSEQETERIAAHLRAA